MTANDLVAEKRKSPCHVCGAPGGQRCTTTAWAGAGKCDPLTGRAGLRVTFRRVDHAERGRQRNIMNMTVTA